MKMKRFEAILFTAALITHLLPVLLITPFVTLDGAAHLYNAGVLKDLLLDSTSLFHRMHEVNAAPEPNWTGHVFMAVSLILLPALVTEKLILVTILTGMALGFRRLVKILDKERIPWLSWLVFPFLYNFTLLLGFFNFSLAMVILLHGLALWMEYRKDRAGVKVYAWMVFILLLIYFSHLLVFLLAIGATTLISFFMQEKSIRWPQRIREALIPLCGSIPGILLAIAYLMKGGSEELNAGISWLPAEKLIADLLAARMFIIYDFSAEEGITVFFSIFLLVVAVSTLLHRRFHKHHFPVFLLFASALMLYFIVPDNLASGGIVSVRLLMWLFICFCLWLVTLNPPAVSRIPIALISFSFSICLIVLHWKTQRALSDVARLYTNAARQIQDRSVVLPLNYSSNWLYSNVHGYMGLNREVLLLDNYEADYGYFPVIWKQGLRPEPILGNFASSKNPCIQIDRFEKTVGFPVDLVSALQFPAGSTDSCTLSAIEQLNQLYRPQPDGDLRIFRRNSLLPVR